MNSCRHSRPPGYGFSNARRRPTVSSDYELSSHSLSHSLYRYPSNHSRKVLPRIAHRASRKVDWRKRVDEAADTSVLPMTEWRRPAHRIRLRILFSITYFPKTTSSSGMCEGENEGARERDERDSTKQQLVFGRAGDDVSVD